MRRAVYIVLGVAWVVGVYVGLKYLPAGVHHFFRPKYCWRHLTENPNTGAEETTTSCNPEWKKWLADALWIGLLVAPLVIVHEYRKRWGGKS